MFLSHAECLCSVTSVFSDSMLIVYLKTLTVSTCFVDKSAMPITVYEKAPDTLYDYLQERRYIKIFNKVEKHVQGTEQFHEDVTSNQGATNVHTSQCTHTHTCVKTQPRGHSKRTHLLMHAHTYISDDHCITDESQGDCINPLLFLGMSCTYARACTCTYTFMQLYTQWECALIHPCTQ